MSVEFLKMEFGDVFSTVDLSPDVIPWKQQFSVQGLRVVSIAASQASSSAGIVTNGTRLSAPGGPTGNLRTDSDIIRWIEGASVGACLL